MFSKAESLKCVKSSFCGLKFNKSSSNGLEAKYNTQKNIQGLKVFCARQTSRRQRYVHRRVTEPKYIPPDSALVSKTHVQWMQYKNSIPSSKQNPKAELKLKEPDKYDIEIEKLVTKFKIRSSQKNQIRVFLAMGLTVKDISKLLKARVTIIDYKASTIKNKIKFFKTSTGMTTDQFKKFLLKFPRILEYNMNGSLLKRIDYFLSIGFEKGDIPKIFLQAPALVELSIEKTLQPRIEFMRQTLGIQHDSLRKIILKHPQLLTYGEQGMIERISVFKEWKLDNDDILKVISTHPQVLHYSISTMREHVKFLIHVGISESSLKNIIKRFPQILALDIEVNIIPKIKYLKAELGGSSKTLERNPVYMGLSLNNRIIPRHKFLISLTKNDDLKQPVPINWFKCSDEVFAETIAKVPLEQFQAFKQDYISARV